MFKLLCQVINQRVTNLQFLVGGGDVLIENWEDYPTLGNPILAKPTEPFVPPKFGTAWVHQLHCLVYISHFYVLTSCHHAAAPFVDV